MKKIFKSLFVLIYLLPNIANAATCTCEEISIDLKITQMDVEKEWVEIKNMSGKEIDLSNYSLEDKTEKPFVLEGLLASLSAIKIEKLPFQLNNSGETLTLKTLDGTWVDSLTFDPSGTSNSDIIDNAVETSTDIQLASETVDTPKLIPIISEILPNPEGSDSSLEWIELYNPYSETITLDGLFLDDIEGGSNAYALSGYIEAESYALYWVEDTGISLNNSSDSVRILGSSKELIIEVNYENPKEGESYSHINNAYEWTNQLSPGSENQKSFTESTDEKTSAYENGDLSENLEITEVFPDPEGTDKEGEWIEITNGGSVTVNLGNWELDDGEAGSDPYIFPDETFIEAGETLVIDRSESGIALNNSNESVRLIDYTGETVDEINYETSTEGESYAKIEIEEIENLQASVESLSTRILKIWTWTNPSPGAINPKWKQFKGEVTEFNEELVTIFDGLSNWSFKTQNQKTEEIIFGIGNTVLIRAVMESNIYMITYSELIESAAINTKNFPWELILTLTALSVYGGVWLYKKKFH